MLTSSNSIRWEADLRFRQGSFRLSARTLSDCIINHNRKRLCTCTISKPDWTNTMERSINRAAEELVRLLVLFVRCCLSFSCICRCFFDHPDCFELSSNCLRSVEWDPAACC